MSTPPKSFKLTHEVSCAQCGEFTPHTVEASAERRQGLWPGYVGADWRGHFSIVTCNTCGLVGYRSILTNGADYTFGSQLTCYVEAVPKLPKAKAVSPLLAENAARVPVELRSLFWQTANAISREEDLFAGVGIRCLASSLAEEIYKRPLDPYQSIVGLISYVGLPEREFARKFHHFGYVRTADLHKCFEVGTDRLSEALAIIEAVLIKRYLDPNGA